MFFFNKLLTVMAYKTTCGSSWFSLFTIDFKQSLAFIGELPTLSQISIISAQFSVVFFSFVAFSEKTIKFSSLKLV